MKIIVASSDYEVSNAISAQFNEIISNAAISVVEAIDDFIEEIKSDQYDFIITDYYFDGIDIWQLSKLINSKQLAPHVLPLYLIKETCETEIPALLAKEYAFQITSLSELAETIQIAQFNNREAGYVRGQLGPAKPTLLVIEDDEDAAEVVYLALKDDYEIDRATDGEQGILLWKKKRHDLVLLDYMLPSLKGDEVLSEIMELDNNQPVVVMTAFDRPEYNKSFILNGASQYLPKPYTLTDLRSQCQILINKAKLIYQTHYTDMKLNKLSALVYELDHHLKNSNVEKARRVMESIKLVLPNNITEDAQVKWGYSES